jgi:hypothetical protein
MLGNFWVSARNARFCVCDSLKRYDTRRFIVGIVKAIIYRTVAANLSPARVESEDPSLVSLSVCQLFQAGVSSRHFDESS